MAVQQARSPVARPGRVQSKNPVPRHTSGFTPWNNLQGKNPNRHYVLVWKAAQEYGIEYYEALGYEVEFLRKDGPRFVGGRTGKDGEPMEYRGHVLMSCSKDVKASIEEYGPDGDSGQLEVDRLEKHIIRKRNGIDPLRGLGNLRNRDGEPILSVENKIEDLQVEEE